MKNILRASQATVSEIPAGDIPDWIQLLPGKGEVMTRDGRGPYQVKDPQKIIKAFAAFKMPLPGDYEHQSMSASEKSGPVGASGWIDAMEVRGNGEVWGHVGWTKQAADLIAAREYRFISPVFDYNGKTGEIIQLVSFALTNNPNLYLRAAAAQEGDKPMAFKEKMLASMNDMGEGSTDKQHVAAATSCIAAHVAENPGDAPDATEPDADDAKPARKPPVAAQDDMAAHARQGGVVDPSKYVPMSMFKEVSDQIKTLRAAETTRIIHDAISVQKKITPAQREWATDYATRDPEGFAAFLKTTAPVVSDASSTRVAPPAQTVETVAMSLTAEEKKAAELFGRSYEDFAKQKLAIEKENAAMKGAN